MSFWGRIFGTEKALESAVDGVKKGLDALVYTDEEKAQDSAKERSEARSMIVGWMEATQGQNLSRRLISLVITGAWVSQYIMAQLVTIVAIWVQDPKVWRDTAEVLYRGAANMDAAVMLILAFYFAAPHMGGIIEALMGKLRGGIVK